jgi:hypothetical protein
VNLAATRDYLGDGTIDDDFPSLGELLSQHKGISVSAKLSSGSTAEETADPIQDGESAHFGKSRADGSQGQHI